VGQSIKRVIMMQGGGPEKKQTSLCSDNVAGGRDGISERENLKNLNMKVM
jgi:hypothetical protein